MVMEPLLKVYIRIIKMRSEKIKKGKGRKKKKKCVKVI